MQPTVPAASLATFPQRIRVRLPICGFQPRTGSWRPPVAIVVRRLATALDREYELVLMLDPDVPDERRDEIAAETRKRIEAGATLKNDTSWGMRKMAYEIRQRTEADYRLFRFEGQGGVLDDLNHNLRIADGVLRFRIFKVDPHAPSVAPPPPVMTSGAPPQRGPRRQEAQAQEAPAQPAPTRDAPAEAPQEAEQAAAEPEAAQPEAEATAEETPAAAAPEPTEPAAAPEPTEPAAEPAAEEPAPESGEERPE
jgi:small subunit ribosomal protein S6